MSNYPTSGTTTGRISTTGPYPPQKDAMNMKSPEEYTVEVAQHLAVSKGILKEKIKQFKLGKYTEKYIRTYLEFVLMEGVIDNLSYLEFLKEIGTN
jgi:hypothetical protein